MASVCEILWIYSIEDHLLGYFMSELKAEFGIKMCIVFVLYK